MRISTGYGEKPMGGGFETFSWYFFRFSGIVLLFLVIIHLFIAAAKRLRRINFGEDAISGRIVNIDR